MNRGRAWNVTAYPPTIRNRALRADNAANSSLKSRLVIRVAALDRDGVQGHVPQGLDALLTGHRAPELDVELVGISAGAHESPRDLPP